jgi:hypothetical protein
VIQIAYRRTRGGVDWQDQAGIIDVIILPKMIMQPPLKDKPKHCQQKIGGVTDKENTS